MGAHFFADYSIAIVLRQTTSGRFRCDVIGLDGEVIIGARGDTEADAIGRLGQFIDGELVRRMVVA